MNKLKKICLLCGLVVSFSGTAFSQSETRSLGLEISTIQNALHQPCSKYFYIERVDGKYQMGDKISHFDNIKDFTHLTFDISNNKVLANMSLQGTLKNITMYRNSYFANCGPVKRSTVGSWPGVWAAKDNSSYGPYSFCLTLNGNRYDLDKVPWDFKIGLLDNLFPITEFTPPGNQYKISVLAFAPISSDGSARIRVLVYGLFLENNSEQILKGTVSLPELFKNNRQKRDEKFNPWSLFDPYDYEVYWGDNKENCDSLVFNLQKGQSIWIPAVFSTLGDSDLNQVNTKTTFTCLKETWQYFRKMLGKVQIPSNIYLSEFYERQVMEAFNSIAMSPDNQIAGTNWGSYPTTRQIWMKDCFYSSLPFMQLEPELAKKLISWFVTYGVRPKGNAQEGGINHSLGLSVSSIILASKYFQFTGDKKYFEQNPMFKNYWNSLLHELIDSRKDTTVWLFSSRFISDGFIHSDYHTGSNVCAWYAIKEYAGLLKNVYNDIRDSKYYTSIAEKVHSDIMKKCTIEGPFGSQFIEGVYRDGRKPQMISDGEESDLTLIPFYGFLPNDDPTYLNYMKFSVSEHNAIYDPVLHSITWFGVPSTAPGYMKGICAGKAASDLFSEHGYYSEVRKVTDADGSVWWWSYGWGKEPVPEGLSRSKIPTPYGEVVRGVPGKSGWFSGVHSVVFTNRFLGLSANAETNSIQFAPIGVIGNFSMADFPVGNQRFSCDYKTLKDKVSISFVNKSGTAKKFETILPVYSNSKKHSVKVNGKPIYDFKEVKYLEHPSIKLNRELAANESITIEID